MRQELALPDPPPPSPAQSRTCAPPRHPAPYGTIVASSTTATVRWARPRRENALASTERLIREAIHADTADAETTVERSACDDAHPGPLAFSSPIPHQKLVQSVDDRSD